MVINWLQYPFYQETQSDLKYNIISLLKMHQLGQKAQWVNHQLCKHENTNMDAQKGHACKRRAGGDEDPQDSLSGQSS